MPTYAEGGRVNAEAASSERSSKKPNGDYANRESGESADVLEADTAGDLPVTRGSRLRRLRRGSIERQTCATGWFPRGDRRRRSGLHGRWS